MLLPSSPRRGGSAILLPPLWGIAERPPDTVVSGQCEVSRGGDVKHFGSFWYPIGDTYLV
jgi:hypothetical protein